MKSVALTPLKRDTLLRLKDRGRIIDRELTWTERELLELGLIAAEERRGFGRAARRVLTITEAGRAAPGPR